ncbi:MAG: TIGR02147 family protein [Chitinispirillaceae bacterium]|nr:TIGR02147 family protein [Chitinispirillaceae bacterium]
MNTALPSVFNYLDFRKYMLDYRSVRIQTDPGFTHYYICHRLGMKNSRSYFNNITSGRKNISPVTIEKLIILFELSPDEANYLRVLINYNQAANPDRREYWQDQLVKMNNAPKKVIPEDCYAYFTTWYHPVIREKLEDFRLKNNFTELASLLIPEITTAQVKESVKLLERLQLIEKDASGYYNVVEKNVATDPNVQRTLIEQYQLGSLDRAKERIVSRPDDHKTATLTFAVSPAAFKRVLSQVDQVKKAILSVAHEDDRQGKKVFELITHLSRQSG